MRCCICRREALPAEEIAETLSVARSNVSTSIRELETWGIVRAVHVLGDRREHYESMKDVWEMFRLVIEQRKRREIDPTREMLRRCLAELDPKEAGSGLHAGTAGSDGGIFRGGDRIARPDETVAYGDGAEIVADGG